MAPGVSRRDYGLMRNHCDYLPTCILLTDIARELGIWYYQVGSDRLAPAGRVQVEEGG